MESTKEPFCKCLYEIENDLPRTRFCFMPCRDQRDIIFKREMLEWWKGLNDSEQTEKLTEYSISNPTEKDITEIYKQVMRKRMVENIRKGNHGL